MLVVVESVDPFVVVRTNFTASSVMVSPLCFRVGQPPDRRRKSQTWGSEKTLQSICILASKHHERSKKHTETNPPDSVHRL
jgi:hypothetical protein